MLTDRRLGQFNIDRKLINDNPELVLNIMSRCIIVECEFNVQRDAFRYSAISDLFSPLIGISGAGYPFYTFSMGDDGNLIAF